jgi:RNA polymerase sigma-70 factor, ECF subfamily
MLNMRIRPQPAVAGVPAIAATAAGETSSDEILVERIAAGNKFAMQALFARHRTSVYRWLLRFVSNETLAEDLLSEVFLDVWRQAARFECRSSVSTWLLSIARHKALSARRRRTDAELDEKIEATVADPADDPEVALQEKNRDELVRRALIRLSPEHRQVIDLVYYHERYRREASRTSTARLRRWRRSASGLFWPWGHLWLLASACRSPRSRSSTACRACSHLRRTLWRVAS